MTSWLAAGPGCLAGGVALSAPLEALERYADIIRCSGFTVMITRSGGGVHWVTRIRIYRRNLFGDELVATTTLGKNNDFARLSHNLGTVCIDDDLHFFGGTFQNPGNQEKPGILHAVGKLSESYSSRFQIVRRPQLALKGTWNGCIERRNHPGFLNKTCEFDGKISAAYHNRRLYLFVRANLSGQNGARHLQVVTGRIDNNTLDIIWSSFQLLEFQFYRRGLPENNIYYMNVHLWQGRFIGVFPAVHGLKARGGVYVSISDDSVRWSFPILVMKTRSFGQRSRIHPVRITDEGVLLYLEGVNLPETPEDESAVFDGPMLRAVQLNATFHAMPRHETVDINLLAWSSRHDGILGCL